jgi:benzylsuccinate CoA-transferase BbsF subunit
MGPKWRNSLTSLRPLAGVRVLSMEQAAALPFATRHLADLGADVIRVQSHRRPAPDSYDIELTRNKRQLAIDLAAPGGPEVFRRVAAACDVVCHNFTPQVVRKFGIDYDSLRPLRPDLIYLEITGFGTDGPWRARPLFGPGAEALAGHNLLIGDPGQWPGRPPTITYADNTCGLYAVLAVTDALARRDRLGAGCHLDISLYETAVSQLGTVLAERGLGAEPERNLNRDAAFAVQGSYESSEPGRYVAVSLPHGAPPAAAAALGATIDSETDLAAALAARPAADTVAALQAAGIPAAVVADAAALTTDEHLWARGYFGLLERHDHQLDGEYVYSGPPFGGGADADLRNAHPVGADTRDILAAVAGYRPDEIDQLFAAGAVGTGAPPGRSGLPGDPATRIERGELSRVDPGFRDRLAAARDRLAAARDRR